MTELVAIEKNQTLPNALDYDFLREKGIEYIQGLSGALWTDHNLHDPGITTLEILSYALTDLGYRTDFDVKDLLTEPNGFFDAPELSGLFPAHEILPPSPITINDYRYLLLKIDGVRNAWLDPKADPTQQDLAPPGEPPIYAGCQMHGLTYQEKNPDGSHNPRVALRGLYRVLLELDIDDLLGSLNETRLVYQVRQGELKGVVLAIDPIQFTGLQGDLNEPVEFKVVIDGNLAEIEAVKLYVGEISLQNQLTTETLLPKQPFSILVINDRPHSDADPLVIEAGKLETVLQDASPEGILPLFWMKQIKRRDLIRRVHCALYAQRNLCEDFWRVETIKPEHVAVCADFELTPDADLEAVQARVFHAIEQYFNPPVHYYTLKEMLDLGYCPEDIFNGPYPDPNFECAGEKVFTKPGFIQTEDLKATELRSHLYVSDLINLLADFPEIIAIKTLLLQKYTADGKLDGAPQHWDMTISSGRQPVLTIDKSKLLFYKGEIPYRAKPAEFLKTLEHLRAMSRKAAYVEPGQELEIETGRYRHLDTFFSIQHDFPKTYGIGKARLSPHASDERIAQARQFKAYLTIFDQILADYLAQLANLRRLFSLDENLKQTYFTPFLTQIAGVKGEFATEIYETQAGGIYLADPDKRLLLTEDDTLYQDRRNRILDHLLARFAESFTDYVLMMFKLEGDPLKIGDELIEDKIQFLRNLRVLSRDRSLAFNYRPEDSNLIWNTSENISGLQQRIARLVGIADPSRRDLACPEFSNLLFRTRQIGLQHRIEIKDKNQHILFKSAEKFASKLQALAAAAELFPYAGLPESYKIDTSGGLEKVFFNLEGGGKSLKHDEFFETGADAAQRIQVIIDRYQEILREEPECNSEGLHLFEHILLRPCNQGDRLMFVCLDPDCESCGDEDPYSFRIQVVLPSWPKRFTNLDFRSFFERTIRLESPAHVHVRVCWINYAQMRKLDKLYHEWLVEKARRPIHPSDLENAQAALISHLEALRTIYPPAELHDCVEGEGENLLVLDRTNLGFG